jgi:hypothetical protein
VDGLIPLEYKSLKIGPNGATKFHDATFGVGDFFGEGTLSWHEKQWDYSLGAGFWAPSGDSAPGPTVRAGLGYWTPMLTAGATWYVDADKTWSISALSRYEINTRSRDTQVTTGQAYTLEWGMAKTIKHIDLGIAGYYQDQVTANHGPTGTPANYNSVAAVGPEINGMIPKIQVIASLRYEYEFLAYNRAQGHTVCLTLTKRF